MNRLPDDIRQSLQRGVVIPAHPLALNANRKRDERRQRALSRYYIAAGAGGLAVGVHTTHFEIRDPKIGLLRLLELGIEAMKQSSGIIRIAGVCGSTKQAISEATLARELGYHAGLLSLAAMKDAGDDPLISHCRAVAAEIPIIGFYLQPAVGGRVLSHSFWRRFCEIENVVAIKIAPFNRYQTIDVVRAVAESGCDDIALYTGNDDNIVMDLITPFRFNISGKTIARRIVAGIHEVLRRQGLLEGIWCLNPDESLSLGQAEEIDRVYCAYPHLNDDEFVAQHLDEWLCG